MKHIKSFLLTTICITNILNSAPPLVHYPIRSQGFDTPRHIVGTHNDIHKFDADKVYGSLTVAPAYTRSFHNDDIVSCLFGQNVVDCNNSITISGSTATNRGSNDWLADYFYLATDFKSVVSFNPVIDNFIIDFNWYLGLDEWVDGLYIAVYAPLTHTRWDLNLEESVESFGTAEYPAGYFSAASIAPGQLFNKFTQYAHGGTPQQIRQTVTNRDVIVALQGLNKAKMSCTRRERTRLADFRCELGWNMLQEDDWHIGLKMHMAAPTGTRPKGEYVFEPIAGNGHHWELGAGLTAHCDFWKSEDRQKRIGFHLDALATHMFGGRHKRTFDLVNKPFSRYMLASRFKTDINDDLQGGGTTPNAQFANEFAPVANLTCMQVDVSIGVQADITAFLNVTMCGWSWDLGYNFWARACEDIKFQCNEGNLIQNQMWGLKGDSRMFGFIANDVGNANLPVALSATQSGATINGGLNGTNETNNTIDAPQLATADGGSQLKNNVGINTAVANTQINTSINPILLTIDDVNPCDSRTRGMSSKLFTHLHYSWLHRTRWVPSLGIGMHVEFAHDDLDCNPSKTNKCPRCAVSNWALWVKGGIAFD